MPENCYRCREPSTLPQILTVFRFLHVNKSDKSRVGDSRVESSDKIGKLVICSENRRKLVPSAHMNFLSAISPRLHSSAAVVSFEAQLEQAAFFERREFNLNARNLNGKQTEKQFTARPLAST